MLNPDFRDILSAFFAEQVDFIIVGAYAVAAHGLPRATGDIDLWINCSEANAEKVWRALKNFGAPATDFSQTDLSKAGTVIQLGVAPRRIDILTEITGVQFAEAREQSITVNLEGLNIPVISREHLIRNKRAVGRPQDLADVARLESLQ